MTTPPSSDSSAPDKSFAYPTSLHVKRPCLLVADMERSLALYRDILGFQLVYMEEASPGSYLYPAFEIPESAKLKFAAFDTESEPRAFALVEVKGIELPPPAPPYRVGTVLRVPSVAETIEKVRSLGLQIVRSNTFSAPPNLQFTEQVFRDRDGHSIVLYEVGVEEK